MVYVALIALVYISKLLSGILPIPERARRLLFLIIAFGGMFFLCGFRAASVGTDMENYLLKYWEIHYHTWGDIFTNFYTERIEIGFALLNKLLDLFTRNPHAIIIASSALFCLGTGRFVYRYLDNDLTAVILLICGGTYLYTFNITRQMIAVALLLNAWGLLTEKKYKASVALFVISMLFHVTSFVFIIAYLFYFLRENRRAVTVLVGLGALVALFHRPILRLASGLLGAFSYIDNSKQKLRAGGIWAVWAIILVIALLYLLYYCFEKTRFASRLQAKLPHPIGELSSVTTLCIPLFSALYVVFAIMGTGFNYLDRFGVYFLPFTVPLFIDFGKRLREQSVALSRVYFIGLHICFVAFFLLFATNLEHYRYALFF